MIKRVARRYDFAGIPKDEWLALNGRLSGAQIRRLKVRRRVFATYRAAKGVLLFPVVVCRAVVNLLRALADIERLHAAPRRRLRAGVGCVIDQQTWLVNGENIELGAFVKISAFSSVIAGDRSRIKIGTNTIIGPGVTIVALNHGMALNGDPIRYQDWTEADVVIGDDVWIGANVVILPGTSVGSGCVIGAGAIVKAAVPPQTVAYMKDGDLFFRPRG